MRSIRVDEYALIELDHSMAYQLNHIGAPIFGPDGSVTLALFLIGFRVTSVPVMCRATRSVCRMPARRWRRRSGGWEPA